MAIKFDCPHCGRVYRVKDDNVGRRFKCKDCGQIAQVPVTSGSGDTTKINRPARKKYSETVKLDKDEPAPKLPPKTAAKPRLPSGLKSPPKLGKPLGSGPRHDLPEAPKTRRWNFLFILGSLAMLAGFFMPWFTPDLPDRSGALPGALIPLEGYRMVETAHEIGLYGDNPVIAAMHASPTSMFVLFLMYLVPLVALYGVIDDIRAAGKGKSHWWYRLLTAVSPLLAGAGVYFVFRTGFDAWLGTGGLDILDFEATFHAVSFGIYTFAGGWLLALSGVFLRPKVKGASRQTG